ncbi:MAG: hypothetical protein U5K72_04360 [Balneolaceae bacterium]|nr:hypothetical protein [Balneolaceae bacterium]
MKDFFASIYEQILYDGKYQLIYDAMYNDQGYVAIGLMFILIPLAIMAIFYFERWFPYLRGWHWVIAVVVGLIIVFASTVGVFNLTILGTGDQQLAAAIANPDSGYYEHASVLRYYYGLYNVLLAFIVSLLYSILFKRFSKLHSHLPI